jgi:ubiquinone biosynthesis UbiH/UbiF/VisC/COQ6 family hydroxylase
MQNKNQQFDFDLVIVGGGLVGASLAIGLAQSCAHLKILVLEQKDLGPQVNDFESFNDFNQKTLAINQGTKLFFDKLGIWPPEVKISDFLTPIKTVQVSMQGAFGQFEFTPPKTHDALGYIIQANILEKFILNHVHIKNLTWVQPISDIKLNMIASGWQVNYLDQTQDKMRQVSARCIIGSDGPNSIVKKSLGILDGVSDYGHIATIANIKLNQHHDYIAYERFTQEGGALALLPYGPDTQMTMVLTLPYRLAKIYQEISDDDFLSRLKNLMGKRLGFEAISEKIQVPLGMKIATHQIARRAILMGNSAHFLHPIAAQGFNLSIQDIAALIHLLEKNKNTDYIGSSAMLHDYNQTRLGDQQAYIQATNKIATYYASQKLPAWCKGMSLVVLNNLPIKNYFTKKSMGVA